MPAGVWDFLTLRGVVVTLGVELAGARQRKPDWIRVSVDHATPQPSGKYLSANQFVMLH